MLTSLLADGNVGRGCACRMTEGSRRRLRDRPHLDGNECHNPVMGLPAPLRVLFPLTRGNRLGWQSAAVERPTRIPGRSGVGARRCPAAGRRRRQAWSSRGSKVKLSSLVSGRTAAKCLWSSNKILVVLCRAACTNHDGRVGQPQEVPAAGRNRQSLPVGWLVAELAPVQHPPSGSADAEGKAGKADEDAAQPSRLAEYRTVCHPPRARQRVGQPCPGDPWCP
jgi:hypothetical protein